MRYYHPRLPLEYSKMDNQAFQLPSDRESDIATFAGCLSDVTYKYYWFLAILDHLNVKNERYFSFQQLTGGMLSYAWYPLDYYRLSFGKQDSFRTLVQFINDRRRLITALARHP